MPVCVPCGVRSAVLIPRCSDFPRRVELWRRRLRSLFTPRAPIALVTKSRTVATLELRRTRSRIKATMLTYLGVALVAYLLWRVLLIAWDKRE